MGVLSVGVGTTLVACSSSSSTIIASNDAGDASMDGASNDAMTGVETGLNVDAGPPSATQACADSAKARCMRSDTCTNGSANDSKYGNEAACETRLAALCVKNLAAMGTGATAGSVETCAGTISAETCDQFLGGDPGDSCLPPVGTVMTGSACGNSAQCQSTYCAIAVGASCGSCATVPALNDACGVTGECGARGGLRCVDNTCITAAAANGTCGKDTPCGPSLSCVIPKAATTGTCVPAVATAGTACDPKRETSAGCDNDLGLYCDPSTSLCVAYTFVADGQPCGVVNDAFVACTAGDCIYPQVAIDAGADAGDGGDAGTRTAATGACKANAADGQPCDTSAGPHCEAPAHCAVTTDGGTSGTCVLPDPTTCH